MPVDPAEGERVPESLQNQPEERITRRLNEVYATVPVYLDPAFVAAQARSIPPETW